MIRKALPAILCSILITISATSCASYATMEDLIKTNNTGIVETSSSEINVESSNSKTEMNKDDKEDQLCENQSNSLIACYSDEVTINKIDYSMYIEESLVGEFFYEKPHIAGGTEPARKINDYFDKDCDEFFSGRATFFGENAFQIKKYHVKESIERWGLETLVDWPFQYSVTSKMTFISEDYISFCQTYRSWTTGPRDTWNLGVTFSVKTGELVPFTEFIDISANTFKENLCDVLLPLFNEYGASKEDVNNTYGPNDDNTFSIKYYDTEISLDTKYFYDGNSIYLTLNHRLYPHDGFIIRWDDIMHSPFTIEYDNTIYVLE